MAEAATSKKVPQCFIPCTTAPPISPEPHPTVNGTRIVCWMQHRKFEACYVPVFETGLDLSFYFCTSCGSWKRISTTTGHIAAHFETHAHREAAFQDANSYSLSVSRKLCKAVILFILENGLPFRLIDGDRLSVIPHLPGQERLQNLSGIIAGKISSIVKSVLEQVEYCSLCMDEWSDLKKERYLGGTCHTMLHDRLRTFTVAHLSLNSAVAEQGRDHMLASDIAETMDKLMEKYAISKKVIMIVTDRASIMKASIAIMNSHCVDNGDRPVMWGCCCCHVINSLLSRFV